MNLTADRGCYQLIIRLNRSCRIEVGALGQMEFKKGYYIYTGRALKGLKARVGRHLRTKKKRHWHIDYLLQKGVIISVLLFPGRRDECKINRDMFERQKRSAWIPRFGSSDCRCFSHLIYVPEKPRL